MLKYSNNKAEYLFYFIILFGFALISYSHPFLRYPYDGFAHLIAIDEVYSGLEKTSTTIQQGRLIWHKIWAAIFHLFNIESTQFFLRTKIIHFVQTSIAAFSIYFFSKVMLRNIFPYIHQLTLKYLSLWATIIWFTIFSTFSVHYHLVWNLWYSLNYQITLPLFFYITALTMVLFLEKTPRYKKVIYILQIIFISHFILQAHAMEFIYYLMYLLVFSLLFIQKIIHFIKRYYYFVIPLVGITLYFFNSIEFDESLFFKYIQHGSYAALYKDILVQGQMVVSKYNRAHSVINELMYVILYLGIFTLFAFIWKKNIFLKLINLRIFIFLIVTSLFVLIPIYEFPAGLFAIITKVQVVHRIYYSASLFILLPVFIYMFSYIFNWKLKTIHLLLFFILSLTYGYSKFTSTLQHNYYKNIQSIQNSFTKKYNFHLSDENIKLIGEKIEYYEKRNYTGKEIYYFARPDIAFVIKYIFHKRVYWHNRRTNIHPKERYNDYVYVKKYYRYNYILFYDNDLPKYSVKDFYK